MNTIEKLRQLDNMKIVVDEDPEEKNLPIIQQKMDENHKIIGDIDISISEHQKNILKYNKKLKGLKNKGYNQTRMDDISNKRREIKKDMKSDKSKLEELQTKKTKLLDEVKELFDKKQEILRMLELEENKEKDEIKKNDI